MPSDRLNDQMVLLVHLGCWQVAGQLLPWRVRLQSGGQVVHQGKQSNVLLSVVVNAATLQYRAVSAQRIPQ
jgi:hypothetical protein